MTGTDIVNVAVNIRTRAAVVECLNKVDDIISTFKS